MSNRPPTNTSSAAHGGSTLLEDDAAGDPASLGVTILLANASTGNAQVNGVSYGDAAREELNYLLYDVPKVGFFLVQIGCRNVCVAKYPIDICWSYLSPSGSSTTVVRQCLHGSTFPWYIYYLLMSKLRSFPLAYYGALDNNQTLLRQAYQQCKLYRDALRQSSGLWIHITGGNGTSDTNLWATGNGWAAAGMLRVWATINWSSFSDQWNSEMSDLESWVREILDASKPYIVSSI